METLLLSVIVVIVAILHTCLCAGPSRDYPCGEPASPLQVRITHGWEADSELWPWHAAIFRRGNGTNDYICGATLIGRNYVVTAAHCVVNRATGHKLNPNVLTVHFGRQYLNESSERVQERPVKEVIIHPQFLHVGLKNDIALLSLKTEVQFNEFMLPVCLDTLNQIDRNSDDLVGKKGVIVGWGKTESGHVSMTLQTATMPVIDRIACLTSDPQFFSQLISYGMFCAGYENGTSVCNGDSGSGMFFRHGEKWIIGGVVSFAGLKADRISCDFHKYAGFTNVRYYIPWIRTIVNDGTSTIDILDANEMGISSRLYKCNYGSTNSSDCNLSNIHLTPGATVGFHANNKSPSRVSVQRSYLQLLPKSLIDAFPVMKYINLENLRIRNFEPNTFKTAANLLSVNLHMNRLEEISRDAFTGARSLAELDLSNNHIEFIDEFAFNSMSRLKDLNLSRNKLTNLPAFVKNNDLRVINASYNLISDVSDDHFVGLRKLLTMDFAHNRLTLLDLKQLDSSIRLKTVDLSYNQLKRLHIPEHAKHLFAQNNSIEIVSTGQCVAETLNLAANKLQTQLGISNCTLLKFLDLSHNLLQSFNYRFIAQMTQLQSLYLSNNQILEIDLPLQVEPVSGLKLLDLSHNLIFHGPSTNAFGKLETLELRHNELRLFDFSNMNQLQKTYLSGNQWDCSVLQGIRMQLADRDSDSCAEGFRKIQDICCKDYKHPYGDMFAAITQNNFSRYQTTKDYLKVRCSVPVINRSVDRNTREILENLSRINTEKKNLQAELDATQQVRLNLSKEYVTVSASRKSLRDKTSTITQIIEEQRILGNGANRSMVTRDGKSNLEVLKEILESKIAELRLSSKTLIDRREYIANIPYRVRELSRSIPELKRRIRSMQHDQTMLEHKEQSVISHFDGLSRMVENRNNVPTRFNGVTASHQHGPEGGVYSDQNYRYNQQGPEGGFYSEHHYEYHSSNFG